MGVVGELVRKKLIRRLLWDDIRFVALFAAAGYGKSTLARQFASNFSQVAICDFRDAQSLRDVGQRIAVALAPNRETAAQAASPIDVDPGIIFDFARQLWSSPGGPQLVIFENAEALREIAGAEARLAGLLAQTPPDRRVCICSRTKLNLQFLNFALPHEVTEMHERDLAFESDDLAEFVDLHGRDIQALYDLTGGWPLCVRLVVRLAQTRGVDTLLQELRSVDFSLLYDYLLEHVIAVLDPLNRSVSIALAGADLCDDDLRRAFPTDAAAVLAFVRMSPFITEHGGFWTLHPLIRASIQREYRDESRRFVAAAAAAAFHEDPVRAAVLYGEVGDFESAALALEQRALAYVSEGGNPDFAMALQRIPRDVLLRHPRLFASAMTFAGLGISNEERYRDAYALRQRFDGSEDEATRISIDVTIANALANLGRHEEALAYVIPFNDPADAARQTLYHMLYGSIIARMGKFIDAMDHWEPLKRIARDAPSTLAFTANEIAVRSARSRGDFSAEREYQSFALNNARKSRNPTAHVLTVIEGMFGAWFQGDDSAFSSLAAELSDLRYPSIMPGTRLVRSCAVGDLRDLSPDVSRPQVHAYAYLLALRIARGDLQRRIAAMACEAADRANEPLLQCFSRVAQSFADPVLSHRALTEAAHFSSRVQSEALQQAVQEIRQGHIPPMFAAIAQSIADIAPHANRYRLVLLQRSLFRGAEKLTPSKREFELLAYLAFRDCEVSRDELAEAFAPEASSADADHLIRVTISRIRKKFGEDLVQSTANGYAIGPTVELPLREMRRRIERCETQSIVSGSHLADISRDLQRLRLYLEGRRFEYEWGERFDAMLEDLVSRMTRLVSQ